MAPFYLAVGVSTDDTLEIWELVVGSILCLRESSGTATAGVSAKGIVLRRRMRGGLSVR